MFGKYISFILGTILLASCADAKYATPNNSNNTPESKLETCQAKFKSNFCVSYTWETMPTDTEFGSFILKTFQPNSGEESPALVDLNGTLAVILWMPDMGHGSSPVTLEHLDVGTYRVSNVFFTMKGDWEIRVQLKDRNEIKDQAIIPISI